MRLMYNISERGASLAPAREFPSPLLDIPGTLAISGTLAILRALAIPGTLATTGTLAIPGTLAILAVNPRPHPCRPRKKDVFF